MLLAEIGEDLAGPPPHRGAATGAPAGQDREERCSPARRGRARGSSPASPWRCRRRAPRAGCARRAAGRRRRISPESRRTWPEMTRDSVDFPAPLAPSSAWVSPVRSVRLAPTSARVCAKVFEIARASRSGVAGSVIVQARARRPALAAPAAPPCHFSSLANTVSLMVGRIWSMFLLVATTIGTRISFSGLPPLSAVTSASPDFTPMR